MTHEELLTYEDALKKDRDYESSMDKKFDEGKAEERLKIAKAMLQRNMDVHTISDITGLSCQQIAEIADAQR